MSHKRILVANRLPYRVAGQGQSLTLVRADGGLATGLRGIHEQGDSIWIGWPGMYSGTKAAKANIERQLTEGRMVPIHLSPREVKTYYEEFSNGSLWPLFHSDVGHIPLDLTGWKEYEQVNRKFAQAVLSQARDGDTVWVHDYQLLMVPGMLRDAMPSLRIGFFLHIPFPSAEVFRILPQRESIMRSLLACDLLGFHIPQYMQNFIGAARSLLGVDSYVDEIRMGDHTCRVAAFPLGVDAATWQKRATCPTVRDRMVQLRHDNDDTKILLGIDRLDYTKGIPRRLMAVDRMLERYPEWHGKVRFVQVSVPSRESVDSYGQFRRQVDELVGRINGRWSDEHWAPIHHIFRGLEDEEISALYQSADVMLVTPVRDGMNLVAKEFVASRVDEDGVLVLSEFAGAAWELGSAVHVNPFDLDATADAMHQALAMSADERRQRMIRMRERVSTYTAQVWAADFIRTLEVGCNVPAPEASPRVVPEVVARVRESLCDGRSLHLLLDYDGTLVPLQSVPELAAPDVELKQLLASLAATPGINIDIVSGRAKRDLDRWLSDLPIGLHAEHGIWSRRNGAAWKPNIQTDLRWKEAVHRLLGFFVLTTQGSFVEEKSTSVAWHYRRNTEDFVGATDFGEYKARELRRILGEMLTTVPAYTLTGHKVVEIAAAGLNKGLVARDLALTDPMVVAIGDDRTDEDLFGALSGDAITIRVGPGTTRAAYRVENTDQVRCLLRELQATVASRTQLGVKDLSGNGKNGHSAVRVLARS